MEGIRSLAVQILNEAHLCTDSSQKVAQISQLTELVLRKQPGLLHEFLPEMAQLQMDSSAQVRRYFAVFLGEAAQTGSPNAQLLGQIAGQVTAILQDQSAIVVKAALLACSLVLQSALALLGAQPADSSVQSAWNSAKAMQQAACALLQSHSSESVRLTAAKLLEGVVLLFTADCAPLQDTAGDTPAPRLPQAAALSSDAAGFLRMLLDLLRPEVARTGCGPVTICTVKAVAAISVARPALLGRILPAMIALAKEGGFKASGGNEPAGAGARGTQLSVGNAMRGALTSILRSRQPSSVPWRDRLVEALGALGAATAAESSLKFIARQDYKDSKAAKQRDAPSPGQAPDPKRPRTDSLQPNPYPHPAAGVFPPPIVQRVPNNPHINPYSQPHQSYSQQHQHQQRPHQQQPHQQQQQQQQFNPQPGLHPSMQVAYPPAFAAAQHTFSALAPLQALLPPPGPAPVVPAVPAPIPLQPAMTSHDELMQLHVMLPALLAHPDPTLVPAFLEALCAGAPAILADLVMAIMLMNPVPPPQEIAGLMEQQRVREHQAEATAQAALAAATAATASVEPQGPSSAPAVLVVTGPVGTTTVAGAVAGPPGVSALPSSTSTAAVLQRALGSGGDASRFNPPGKPALPPDIPPSAASQQAVQTVAPPAAATVVLMKALQAGAPLVPPNPLPPAAAYALHASSIRRMCGLASQLPAQALDLRERLLARLAAQACCIAHIASTQQQTSPDAQEAAASVTQSMLDAALAGIMAGQGQALALRWLSTLLTEQLQHSQTSNRTAETVLNQVDATQGSRNSADSKLLEEKQLYTKSNSLQAASGVSVKAETGVHSSPHKQEGHQASNDRGDEDMGEGPSGQQTASITTNPVTNLQLAGTPYESALLDLLGRLRDIGLWQELRALLAEVPVITVPGCTVLLQELVTAGGEAATAVLILAREIILARAPLRDPFVQLVLQACYDPDSSTRSKAVRLCCNQLAVLLEGALAPPIITAATDALHSLLRPPTSAASDGTQQSEWTTSEATRYCELYATLCVRNHELLSGLMSTYASASLPVRSSLLTASEALARALGQSNPTLLQLVRHRIDGSDALVEHMVDVLCASQLPSEAMVTACRERADAQGHCGALAPVLAALDKEEVLALLPALIQVPTVNLKQIYRRLATSAGALGDPLFTPAELLVALHALDPRQDNVPPRALIAAVDEALHAPDVFPQQAVAQAVQQMESQPALPLLFMRTVISSLKALPTMRKFMVELLARLISRQIWLDSGQWRGFLVLVENSGLPFFPLMLQLPAPVLERALGLAEVEPGDVSAANEPRLPSSQVVQLAAWALSPKNTKQQVAHDVAILLRRVLETHELQKVAVEKAAVDAAQALAAAQEAVLGTAAQATRSTLGDASAAGDTGLPDEGADDDDEADEQPTEGVPLVGPESLLMPNGSDQVMAEPDAGVGQARALDVFDLDCEGFVAEEEGQGPGEEAEDMED